MGSRLRNYNREARESEFTFRRKSSMSDLKALSGTVALVTGGTRGIGRGIANALLQLGATVVITGRDKQKAVAAAEDLTASGGTCEGVECDVRRLASVAALGDHISEKYCRLDILVNNAGTGAPASLIHELSPEI